jgi:hypothetical protein
MPVACQAVAGFMAAASPPTETLRGAPALRASGEHSVDRRSAAGARQDLVAAHDDDRESEDPDRAGLGKQFAAVI